jgi:hypothetical protein
VTPKSFEIAGSGARRKKLCAKEDGGGRPRRRRVLRDVCPSWRAIAEASRVHSARATPEQPEERRINSPRLDFLLSQCFDEAGRPRSLGSTAMRIIIETETPNESRTMFRVLVDQNTVGKGLTAVQAQLVTAEIIERLVLPRKRLHLRPAAN